MKALIMFDKFDFSSFLHNLHIFLISSFFGIASFLLKVREDKIKATIFNFTSELVFACVSGYIAMKLSNYWNMDENLKWVFVSISAWSGSKFLSVLELILERYITEKFFGKSIKIEIEDKKEVEDKKEGE